jgi:streptogramin lyase
VRPWLGDLFCSASSRSLERRRLVKRRARRQLRQRILGGCFAESFGTSIGRITTGGAITEYPLPLVGSLPRRIASGPDQRVWFTEAKGNKIGALRPSTASPRSQ